MEQRTLVRWLKILVIFASVCGIAICVGILPMVGKRMIEVYPEFSYCYHPWLIFLWILAVPCFIALVLAWKIFKNIEEDHSFCMENADALRKISFLAAADSAVLFVGNVLFLLLNMNHPSIFTWSMYRCSSRYRYLGGGCCIVSSGEKSGEASGRE